MEELLASQSKKFATLHRNQQVEGEVIAINDKEITLDLGTKSEGIIQAREIQKERLKELKVGDKLKVYVLMVENESGQAVLSTSPQIRTSSSFSYRQGLRPHGFKGHGINWPKFTAAQNQKSKISGSVVEVNKGGLIVEVDGARGFLPNSQVGFELLSKVGGGMENLIGQNLNLTVIETDQGNNKLILSQRGQVSEEVKNQLKAFKSGQKVTGKIVAILPFGLVVNVAGSEGLVFISDVAWEKVEDLSTEFKLGEEIEVLITGLDAELGRLNLSIKQLSEDPFGKLSEKYPADEVVKGEVTQVSEAGVAVKFEDGIDGFLPASKMDPKLSYEVGKSISFLVDSVDAGRRRINLAPFVTSTAGLIYK